MHILKEVLKRKYRYITYCCVKDSQNCDIYAIYNIHCCYLFELYAPRSEKTGLRGFRPGPTQTRLYSQRRWLEA